MDRQKIIQGIQLNSPHVTGVEFKLGFVDEATSFFTHMCQNTHVKSLKISGDGLEDKSAPALGQCLATNRSITYLDMGNCVMGLNGMVDVGSALRTNGTIRALRLGPFTKKTGNGIEHILAGLVDKHHFVRLELIGINMADSVSFAKAMMKFLPRSYLTYLMLDSCNLTDDALQILGPALLQCRTLQSLLVYRNKFSPGATKALLKLLGGFSGLPLKRIGLNGVPCKKLDILLTLCPEKGGQLETLRELDLSGCKITNDGATAVFQVIGINKPLARVDLSDNEILNIRSLALGKTTTNLTDLNLAGNKLSEESLSQLSQELPLNRALTRLNISRNAFSAESAKQFLNPMLLASSKLKELIVETGSVIKLNAEEKDISPRYSPQLSRSHSFSRAPSDLEDSAGAISYGTESPLSSGGSRAASFRSFSRPSASNSPMSKVSPIDVTFLKAALVNDVMNELQPQLRSLVSEQLYERLRQIPNLQSHATSLEREILNAVTATVRVRFLRE